MDNIWSHVITCNLEEATAKWTVITETASDPQAFVAAIEAFVGLLIEVTFIATLTQRLFGK